MSVNAKIVMIKGHMVSAPLLSKETLLQLEMIRIDGKGNLKDEADPHVVKNVQEKRY